MNQARPPAGGADPAPRPRAPLSPRRAAQVRAEQVRSVYLQSPFTTAGSLVAGAILVAALWSRVSHAVLIGWALAMCAHQALRMYHYFSYIRASREERTNPRWGSLYIFAAATAGVLWGAAGALMYVPDSVPHQAVLLLILYGIAAVSMGSLSALLPAFHALILLMMVPVIARMLVQGDVQSAWLAAPAIVVLAVALGFGRNVNRLITSSIRQRLENLDLIEELEEQRAVADRARQEAEAANRAKSKFLAAASHDLRQPLHAMGLFAAALQEKVRDPEVAGVVNSINASVEALENLFNELLDISKLDAGVIERKMDHIALDEMLHRLRMDYEPEAFAKDLEFRVRPGGEWVHSDPMLLERILRNFIGNALRYTQEGGILVGCRRRGERIRIAVWDTGIGIPREEQEHIFEEFYQVANPERSSKKGLGLGLAIIRRLSQLLDHPVGLQSTPGRGSVFWVEVPRGRKPAARRSAGKAQARPGNEIAGKRVVVIDDEPAITEGMRVLLAGWGCDAVVAASAGEAIAALDVRGSPPDLLIADYRLADDATGIEAIEALRARYGAKIPAILVTGSTTPERTAEATARGYHLLLKPVMPAKLRSLINFKLSGQRAGD